MKIKKITFANGILIAVIMLAAFLRLWQLGSIPPGLTPDEAALGYNAYSILKTGRDEYGQVLPVIFKSFGDYKPGLYVYLTTPAVALFGLTEFAVRFPSALAGVLAIWLIYLILNRLTNSQPATSNSLLGLLAAFLLAINPWHIGFSRGAWETNVSLTLTLFGIYFFLKALTNVKFFIVSSSFFALTLLTYQGSKLATLIVVLTLLLAFWRNVWQLFFKHFKFVSLSIFIAALISLPILLSFVGGKTGRLTIFSIFSYPRPTDYLQNFLDEGNENVGSPVYYLLHSETLNFTRGIMGRWFNHFSTKFLFFEGDYQNPQHSAPNSGLLLFFDLLLLPLGATFLLRKRSKLAMVTFLWLFLSPLPAILSRDQVHAVRAINMLIPLVTISATGLMQVVTWFKTFQRNKVAVTLGSVLALVIFTTSFIYYLDAYFVHLSAHDSARWGYDFKKVVETITPIQNNYSDIKVQQSFAQPHIYFLFYQKYDPAKYQKQANLVESEYKGDVGYITKLDNIQFVPIDWSRNRGDHGSLIIADTIRIPDADSKDPNQFTLIADIKYLNGITAYKIIEIK